MVDRSKHELALRVSVQEMRDVATRLRLADDEVWLAATNFLNRLYAFEEFEQGVDRNYYAHRSASDIGQTVAGLMWFRAMVTHDGIDVDDAVPHQFRLFKAHGDGNYDEVTLRSPLYLMTSHWPNFAGLPKSREKHDRDLLYQKFVSLKPIMAPVTSAEAFFLVERAKRTS